MKEQDQCIILPNAVALWSQEDMKYPQYDLACALSGHSSEGFDHYCRKHQGPYAWNFYEKCGGGLLEMMELMVVWKTEENAQRR